MFTLKKTITESNKIVKWKNREDTKKDKSINILFKRLKSSKDEAIPFYFQITAADQHATNIQTWKTLR